MTEIVARQSRFRVWRQGALTATLDFRLGHLNHDNVSPLLNLPVEVLQIILSFVLITQEPIEILFTGNVHLGGRVLKSSPNFLAILSACRVLRREGLSIFFGENIFAAAEEVFQCPRVSLRPMFLSHLRHAYVRLSAYSFENTSATLRIGFLLEAIAQQKACLHTLFIYSHGEVWSYQIPRNLTGQLIPALKTMLKSCSVRHLHFGFHENPCGLLLGVYETFLLGQRILGPCPRDEKWSRSSLPSHGISYSEIVTVSPYQIRSDAEARSLMDNYSPRHIVPHPFWEVEAFEDSIPWQKIIDLCLTYETRVVKKSQPSTQYLDDEDMAAIGFTSKVFVRDFLCCKLWKILNEWAIEMQTGEFEEDEQNDLYYKKIFSLTKITDHSLLRDTWIRWSLCRAALVQGQTKIWDYVNRE